MSWSETVEKTDIEAGEDDIFEIKQEFEDLKERKISKLNKQDKNRNDVDISNKNSSDILTGVVTKINNIDEKTVEIVVEYVDKIKKKKVFS
jgi:hypothetical protein